MLEKLGNFLQENQNEKVFEAFYDPDNEEFAVAVWDVSEEENGIEGHSNTSLQEAVESVVSQLP